MVALAHVKADMVPTGKATVLVKLQVRPPMFNAKFAIPVVSSGVPVMVYTNVPAPFAKVPGEHVAVRPYIPVDVTVCPLCEPPLPPV